MRYMLLAYAEEAIEGSMTDGEAERLIEDFDAFISELRAEGVFVSGARLHPTSTSKTLRGRPGRMTTTDGPFAETKEHFGGFLIVDVHDEEHALRLAQRMPSLAYGAIEVRPVWLER